MSEMENKKISDLSKRENNWIFNVIGIISFFSLIISAYLDEKTVSIIATIIFLICLIMHFDETRANLLQRINNLFLNIISNMSNRRVFFIILGVMSTSLIIFIVG
jgi:hypothetical protein